jgi:hypothetical protein
MKSYVFVALIVTLLVSWGSVVQAGSINGLVYNGSMNGSNLNGVVLKG